MERPTGMVVLAVLNFLGGLAAITGAALSLDDLGATGRLKAPAAVSNGLAIVMGLMLIGAGVGYLKGKRVLGRYVGNAYSLTALGFVVLSFATDSVSGATLVAIFYPVVTLACLNGPYKEWLTG